MAPVQSPMPLGAKYGKDHNHRKQPRSLAALCADSRGHGSGERRVGGAHPVGASERARLGSNGAAWPCGDSLSRDLARGSAEAHGRRQTSDAVIIRTTPACNSDCTKMPKNRSFRAPTKESTSRPLPQWKTFYVACSIPNMFRARIRGQPNAKGVPKLHRTPLTERNVDRNSRQHTQKKRRQKTLPKRYVGSARSKWSKNVFHTRRGCVMCTFPQNRWLPGGGSARQTTLGRKTAPLVSATVPGLPFLSGRLDVHMMTGRVVGKAGLYERRTHRDISQKIMAAAR